MRKKIYLIPGTMCTEQLWSSLLPLLINSVIHHYEFVHVKIPQDKNFAQISDFLNDYFTEDKVTIIGFSLGGYIAAHFAVTYAQRVSKLFVIANSPCALNKEEIQQRQAIVEFVDQYGYQDLSRTRAMQLFDKKQLLEKKGGAEQRDNLINIMITMAAELGAAEFISQMHCTTARDDLFEQLACISAQAVFYYSEADPLVNSAWLVKLQQVNNRCQIICSSGASHMLVLEKPDELASHIHAWLSA